MKETINLHKVITHQQRESLHCSLLLPQGIKK